MTALACIRVFIGADLATDKVDALAPLIAKVGSAFLDGRWKWPRRHAAAAPFAFLLTDPRVERLDPNDLRSMAEELQHRLFGDHGEGEVCLLMLEGDQAEIQRFAAADRDTLCRLLQGEDVGLSGRLTEIAPEGARVLLPDAERDGDAPPHRALRLSPASRRADPVLWRGVYNCARQVFVGSAIATYESRTAPDEDRAQLWDMEGLLAARLALRSMRSGLLFCPISYSCLIRPSLRDGYLPVLDALDPADRPRLAVTIYDMPRQPSFAALRQIRALTEPYFSYTDYQITDPEFEVAHLQREAVSSVTLRLPTADRRDRLIAMRTFLTRNDVFRRGEVWQAMTNVETAEEIQLAVKGRAPFLCGPAVTDLLTTPVGGQGAPVEQLPMHGRRVLMLAS
ncbi:MAG: hypothetical protein JWR84_3628 [Caulobacter sp.]|nr:hypothetical protein [Caulobacter sp.]